MTHHNEMVTAIRKAGNRMTLQCESVLEVVANSNTHLTAQEILEQVRARYPFFTKSTVYRNLDTLVLLGLVTQTDLGQGRVEFELHRHPHHHHLVCKHCGKCVQVDHALFTQLEMDLQARHGFQADLDHFAIFGTCSKCQNKKPAVKKPRAEVHHAHS